MKKLFIIVGVILIAAALIWKFAVVPRAEVRFPDGWKWSLTTFGTSIYADDKTGQFPAEKKFPGDDDVSISERVIGVSHDNVPAGSVRLDDHYQAKDPNTGAVTWDFTYQAQVDPVTGKYTDEKYKNDYFLFPRNVQQQIYNIRNTSYPGLAVAYQGQTTIEGLPVYEFAFAGSYNNTPSYPDTKLADGQTIQCTHLDLHYWVEPLTGEVIKYTEACNADAVMDKGSTTPVKYLSRWSGETQSNSVIARVNEVSAMRNSYLLQSTYLPLLLGVLGVLLLVSAFVLFRPKAVTPAS